MFGFLSMMGNYESRKVDRYEGENLVIDTCLVTDDPDYPYETAVSHPEYNNGEWVIVEQYLSKEDAKTGHNKWVEIMTNSLPDELINIGAGNIGKLLGNRIIKRIIKH